MQIILRGGELTVIGPATPDPLLAPSTLTPVGEHTFRVETKDGYGIPGELAVFEVDAAGHVTRVRFGENLHRANRELGRSLTYARGPSGRLMGQTTYMHWTRSAPPPYAR